MTLKQFVIAGLTAATVIFAVVGFGYVGRTIVQGGTAAQIEIPNCEEDEPFLVGSGDFENGRWTDYQCVHRDEVKPGTLIRLGLR